MRFSHPARISWLGNSFSPRNELQEVPGVREVCLDCKLNPGKGYEIERRMDGFLNISQSLFFKLLTMKALTIDPSIACSSSSIVPTGHWSVMTR